MIDIIPENKRQSTAQMFGQAFGNLGREVSQAVPQYLMGQEQQASSQRQMQQEAEQIKQLTGLDVTGLSPENRKKAFEYALSGQQDQISDARKFDNQLAIEREKYGLKSNQEKKEKLAPFQAGLDTLNKMRSLVKRGNLGVGSSWSLNPATQKDYGEYEQLGKSLISLASNIPIRNKAEFEALAHNLYDPSLTDVKKEGILSAMEQIINQNMAAFTDEGASPAGVSKKPPLSSFHKKPGASVGANE